MCLKIVMKMEMMMVAQVMSALAPLPSLLPLGLCYSRPGPGLLAVDLTDTQAGSVAVDLVD